jgi:DNA ligase (NAD+)
MEDEHFDRLAEEHDWGEVGYKHDGERTPHMFQMYSLQKHYTDQGAKHPLFTYADSIITTPKLDGASISIQYKQGLLDKVLTRGDGKEGIDITAKFLSRVCFLIPKSINYSAEDIQVTGEVVSPKTIPNARNYAAGALNLKDVTEFLSRDLTFVVHGVNPSLTESYSTDMYRLQGLGFRTIVDRDYTEFPQDGTVWRIDSNSMFESLGYTAHHPRGSFAFKIRKEAVETTLNNVEWQVGKSGVVSPVAILEPIEIDGATISRATLHNMKYIESLNLEIGCQVKVIRSGDIIPRIVERVEK